MLLSFVKMIVVIIALCGCRVQAGDVIRYHLSKAPPDAKQSYYIGLLELALNKSTDKYGAYTLEPVVFEMSQGRTSIMVQLNQGIDITWRVTSRELEQRLQAIYIPLLKGMMGHRIFIINRDQQHKFSANMSLEELRGLSAGQGYDWPDSIILQHNGVNVVEGGTMNLLNMLARGRFDYFPRALHEPWSEIADKPQFIVEQQVLLRYPNPFYFFVNKENTSLYQRVQYGLEQAMVDGSFDEYFYQHPLTKNVLELSNTKNRKIFDFQNPILSDKSQALVNEAKYWINNDK